tara:strand:+ start:603 stop:914 length:312 start_codon:yes stop_codon:yes gene_type:complete
MVSGIDVTRENISLVYAAYYRSFHEKPSGWRGEIVTGLCSDSSAYSVVRTIESGLKRRGNRNVEFTVNEAVNHIHFSICRRRKWFMYNEDTFEVSYTENVVNP